MNTSAPVLSTGARFLFLSLSPERAERNPTMVCVNKFMAIGNITRDPELRYLPEGQAVLDLTLAVDAIPGEKGARTDFFPVTVWGKPAEACAKYLQKGSLVHVEGRVRQERWEDQGEKRSRLVIVAERVKFLAGTKKVEKSAPESTDEASPDAAPSETVQSEAA